MLSWHVIHTCLYYYVYRCCEIKHCRLYVVYFSCMQCDHSLDFTVGDLTVATGSRFLVTLRTAKQNDIKCIMYKMYLLASVLLYCSIIICIYCLLSYLMGFFEFTSHISMYCIDVYNFKTTIC